MISVELIEAKGEGSLVVVEVAVVNNREARTAALASFEIIAAGCHSSDSLKRKQRTRRMK